MCSHVDMVKLTNMTAVLEENWLFFPPPLPFQIGSREHNVDMNANPYHCAALACLMYVDNASLLREVPPTLTLVK